MIKTRTRHDDSSLADRFIRMAAEFRTAGPRRTLEAAIVVHQYRTPHVLLVQVGSSFFRLPGGEAIPGEDDATALRRTLDEVLAQPGSHIDWNILDALCVWWRPNYENPQYPYIPPHVTRPKEVRRIFLVGLPEALEFAVPKNYRLVAAPIFELMDNSSVYGPVIATLPYHLSR